MMKKLAALAASAALMGSTLLLPVSAFADASATCEVKEDGSCTAIAVNNSKKWVTVRNRTRIKNTNVAVAVSGGNTQHHVDDNNTVSSGDATATATSKITVNNNVTVNP